MTKAELKSQALELPEEDRLALAEELWASLPDPGSARQETSIPQWHKDLLDERLEETKNDQGKPWSQVKAEIWPTDS